ncbi:MAG: hypothetical protein JJU11_18400 [Candidatus Sumerlaeia bacterium]|nr:hypothetical protein [Candidatus Sumerlaeia bacterium]
MTKYSFQTLLGLLVFLLGGAPLLTAQTITADIPTTPTCIPSGFLGPSTASPPDGAVYRVGEPVLVESDPYFATLDFCWFDHIGQDRSVRTVTRDIHQSGLTGVLGLSDPTEVLHFNVPGTVIITRTAYLSMYGPISTTQNTITIIDDGPRPFPEPVSAPPGEMAPRIEWEFLPIINTTFGNRGVITRDGSYQRLTVAKLINTGNSDLVIRAIYPWVHDGIVHVFPKSERYPIVIRPGQTRYLELEEHVLDWKKYETSEYQALYRNMVVESNSKDRPYFIVGSGRPIIVDSKVNVPSNILEAPPIPQNIDPTVCNDTNNDGTIDAGDIVTSILGGGAP